MSKILIIDDDDKIRKFVARIVVLSGDEIIEASNGVEGLAAAAREHPDVIICDLWMPVMDGFTTLKHLKKDKQLKDVPVIMLTGNSDRETILKCIEIGASYFFSKPVDFGIMKNKIQQVLDSERSKTKERTFLTRAKDSKFKTARTKPLVIVCEPNKILVKKLSEALETNYELIIVGDGASCLKAIMDNSPNVVLIEPQISFLSGFEIAARVKSSPEMESIKLVVFSSPNHREEIEKYATYFDGIVHKPYSASAVEQIVSNVLQSDYYNLVEGKDESYIKFSSRAAK